MRPWSPRRLRSCARGAFAGDPSRAYVYAVAALAYEMLGGVKAEGSSATYVPIPGLSEQGNAVLRRALTPGHHFDNARAFVESMPEEVATITQPARAPPCQNHLLAYREAPSDVMGMAVDRRCHSPAHRWHRSLAGVRFAQRLRIAQAPRIEAVSPTPEPVATSPPLTASTPSLIPVATLFRHPRSRRRHLPMSRL